MGMQGRSSTPISSSDVNEQASTQIDQGELRIQVSKTLPLAEAAQADPDNHRDLIVRVAGYSDYFCDLREALQEEIITRTEHDGI